MGDFDEFINVDLNELRDDGQPLPQTPTKFVIYTAQLKKKPEKPYPYLEVVANPIIDGQLSERRIWTNMTFHPGFIRHVKNFFLKTLGTTKIPTPQSDGSIAELQGKQFIGIPVVENDFSHIDPASIQGA